MREGCVYALTLEKDWTGKVNRNSLVYMLVRTTHVGYKVAILHRPDNYYGSEWEEFRRNHPLALVFKYAWRITPGYVSTRNIRKKAWKFMPTIGMIHVQMNSLTESYRAIVEK